MKILLIAWRNVWRNPTRSLVIITATGLGLMVGVYSTALFKGMSEMRIQAGIETEVGHLQIHRPGFTVNYDPNLFMDNTDSLERMLAATEGMEGFSGRYVLNAMVSSAENGLGVRVTGIQAETEKKVRNLYKKVIQGEYLGEEGKNPVLIGDKLARKLGVRLKSKIILTFQDTAGNIIRSAFRVKGIYRTDSDMYDELNVFVRYNELGALCGYPPGSSHEIAVMMKDAAQVPGARESLKSRFPDFDIRSWDQLSPELGYLTSVMDQYMYIFVIIILLALGFGIVNTMLMVVLERSRELGMLMAVGMNRFRVFRMIMLETVMLTLTGGVAGIVSGVILSRINEVHGLSLSQYSDGLRALGYSPVIYTKLETEMVVIVGALVLLTGVLASVYPALKTLKLNPAEAIRHE